MITCPNCNNQVEDGAELCNNCGKQIFEDSSQSTDKTQFEDLAITAKSIKKKRIAIGSACVAVGLAAVMTFTAIFGSRSKNNCILYMKDNEMYYTGTEKIDPLLVSDNLYENGFFSKTSITGFTYTVGEYTHLSSDGQILFYASRFSNPAVEPSLFYRYVNKPEQEPVEIDSGIISYTVSESGECVTYLKGDTLYQHNLSDKAEIDSKVSYYEVSDDGKKIYYLGSEGGLYLKNSGKDKEQIDSAVSKISYISEDFNTVYYIKENSLYKQAKGKDKVKIASDVVTVIKVYETGEAYYLKPKTLEFKLIDFVEEDSEDSAKDQIRQALAEETITKTLYVLCFYNGNEEKVINDACEKEYSFGYTVSENRPVIIFSDCNQSASKLFKLSNIESTSLKIIKEMLNTWTPSTLSHYIAVKDTVTVVKSGTNLSIDPDGKTVYFQTNLQGEISFGDVYKMSISGNKPQEPELYDSGVCIKSVNFGRSDYNKYYKNVQDADNLRGDLYLNKEKIDSDVRLYYGAYHEDAGTTVYFTNWDIEKDSGTLKIYKDGKVDKIADNAHTYSITPGGEVLYLQDYSKDNQEGKLYLYKNGKSELVDENVVAIIQIDDSKYKGVFVK